MSVETLQQRIALEFENRNVIFQEKKMFGGVCFLVDDKMCVGVNKDSLMVRLDPEIYDDVLKRDGVREMDFTKRPMKGFVFVEEDVLVSGEQLGEWIGLALDFNPKARSSKKRKKNKEG